MATCALLLLLLSADALDVLFLLQRQRLKFLVVFVTAAHVAADLFKNALLHELSGEGSHQLFHHILLLLLLLDLLSCPGHLALDLKHEILNVGISADQQLSLVLDLSLRCSSHLLLVLDLLLILLSADLALSSALQRQRSDESLADELIPGVHVQLL